jgi:DNA repair photolyase
MTNNLVQIDRMGGKPVFNVPAKSVVNFTSGFGHKLLCDSLTFSAGSACQYSCTFCYVTDLMKKSPHLENVRGQFRSLFPGEPIPSHSEIVIRREGVLNALRSQLTSRNKPKFTDPNDNRVLYMSPLVDVAANLTLCEETAEACKIILSLTHWQIRILSKSSFLPRIAQALDLDPDLRAKDRVIYGLSTGTLDDDLARSFEQGTPLVSKRIESLHWLQDEGYRTFGMICPSLPYGSADEYREFSQTMCEAIRVDRCEHVWAEIMNVRGESFTRTLAALREAGYLTAADLLDKARRQDFWEQYSRDTFLAHTEFVPAEKLRFLQYINAKSKGWWQGHRDKGAILLGPSSSN